MRMNLSLTTMIVGLFATGAYESGRSEISSTSLSFNECIDCQFDHFDPDPPEPGFNYVYYLGASQCEDGYSEHGPCPPCEGELCSEGEIFSDESDLCNLEECPPSRELYAAVTKAVEREMVRDLQSILDSNPQKVRMNEKRSMIELYNCRGTLYGELPIRGQVKVRLHGHVSQTLSSAPL